MIRQQLVYLVGPITGCSYAGCTEWRDVVKEELEATGSFHCLTPMRGKQHLVEHTDLPATIPEHVRTPGASDHDILSRDFYDCNRADVLFCNLTGAARVSIGSMFELAWGYANRDKTFTVVCMEHGNIHWHAFPIQSAGVILPTVEEGVAFVKEVLNA